MTQRMKYNLMQSFTKLKNEYEDESVEYEVIDEDKRKVTVKFTFRNKERTTIFFKAELRSIGKIYSVLSNII